MARVDRTYPLFEQPGPDGYKKCYWNPWMLTDEFVSYLSRMNVYNLGGGTRLEKTYLVQNEASINLAWVDKGVWIEATA